MFETNQNFWGWSNPHFPHGFLLHPAGPASNTPTAARQASPCWHAARAALAFFATKLVDSMGKIMGRSWDVIGIALVYNSIYTVLV